jgi:hypothetical protein
MILFRRHPKETNPSLRVLFDSDAPPQAAPERHEAVPGVLSIPSLFSSFSPNWTCERRSPESAIRFNS